MLNLAVYEPEQLGGSGYLGDLIVREVRAAGGAPLHLVSIAEAVKAEYAIDRTSKRVASQQHPLAHVIHCIVAASMFVGKRLQKNVRVVAGGTA